MNERIVLNAVLELLDNEITMKKQSEKIAELEAELEDLRADFAKQKADYEKLKAEDNDPKAIERKFHFWVEMGVLSDYYE